MPQRFQDTLRTWFTSRLLMGGKKTKMIERMMSEIFRSSSLMERGNVLATLIQTCLVFAPVGEQKVFLDKTEDLFTRISEQLIERDAEAVALCIYYLSFRDIGSLGVEQYTMLLLFMEQFFIACAKSVDRACKFALMLLRYRDATSFGEHASQVDISLFESARQLVTVAANGLPTPGLMPIKQWILVLLDEAARRENEIVDRLLFGVLQMFALHLPRSEVHVESRPVTKADIDAVHNRRPVEGNDARCFWVLPRHMPVMARIHRLYALTGEHVARVNQVMMWFQNNVASIQRTCTRLWHDIRNTPRRTLHPNGDVIKIGVTPCALTGITSVTLFSQGTGFDRVRVVFDRMNPGGIHGYEVEATLVNGNLQFPDPLVVNHLAIPEHTFGVLLHTIVVDALYQIVVEDPQPHSASHPSTRRRSNRLAEGRSFEVRAHLMRLPSGKKPTPDAVVRAQAVFGNSPQPGFTFRVSHIRAGRLVTGEEGSGNSPRQGRHPYTDENIFALLNP